MGWGRYIGQSLNFNISRLWPDRWILINGGCLFQGRCTAAPEYQSTTGLPWTVVWSSNNLSFRVNDESVVHSNDPAVGRVLKWAPVLPQGDLLKSRAHVWFISAFFLPAEAKPCYTSQYKEQANHQNSFLCICCWWEHFVQLKIHLATEKNVWGTFTGCSHSPLINKDQYRLLFLLNKCNVRKSIVFYLFQFNWIICLGRSMGRVMWGTWKKNIRYFIICCLKSNVSVFCFNLRLSASQRDSMMFNSIRQMETVVV